jgi:hypothetical protein
MVISPWTTSNAVAWVVEGDWIEAPESRMKAADMRVALARAEWYERSARGGEGCQRVGGGTGEVDNVHVCSFDELCVKALRVAKEEI